MASKTILFLGLVFALVLLISSDVVSARTDPAAAETKSVQPEGSHHEEHHHHHCHGHHCDEKDKKEGEDEADDDADADDHKKKRCKHWPHC